MALQVGNSAPQFDLEDYTGQRHTLADYAGHWLLLYFYPQDDTPGCTTEACSLRDHWSEFQQRSAVVVGVSTDSPASHAKFIRQYHLPFTLLADPMKTVVTSYGVYGQKSFLGKNFFGTKRVSFLIDPQGKIVKIYDPVKPANHAAQVLTDLQQLQ